MIGQLFGDRALHSETALRVYNREVLPRWKEKFGGASVTG
jgi:hypothetical protein